MSLPWAPSPLWLLLWARRAQGAASHSIHLPRELLGRGNTWFEGYCKNLSRLERETPLQKEFVHFRLAFQNPRIVSEQLRAPRRTSNAPLMGGESWAGMEERFCSDFSKYQRVQVPAPHTGKDWGESTSKQFSKEHHPLGAGKGRLFFLHFICVGISYRENPENPLLEVVPVQPWICPNLHSVMSIILSILGTHNSEIWFRSPKLVEFFTLLAAADVGKHQGQRKGDAGISKLHHRLLHSKAAMIKLSLQITTILRNAVIPGNCLSTWIPVWIVLCCRGEYQL